VLSWEKPIKKCDITQERQKIRFFLTDVLVQESGNIQPSHDIFSVFNIYFQIHLSVLRDAFNTENTEYHRVPQRISHSRFLSVVSRNFCVNLIFNDILSRKIYQEAEARWEGEARLQISKRDGKTKHGQAAQRETEAWMQALEKQELEEKIGQGERCSPDYNYG